MNKVAEPAKRAECAQRKVFFDIDTQYDFMNPEGLLYVRGAEKIVPNLRKITALACRYGIPVVSTLDWHTRRDPEFKVFPEHCVRNTSGAAKIPATTASGIEQVMVRKCTCDAFSNPRTKRLLSGFTDVYVYGVALDYCVKAACLGAVKLGLRVYLIKDATKAVSPETGRAAI
ncbi:MAG: isochorismatase family protein, partial [Candidatus Omnitrophota bacterium]